MQRRKVLEVGVTMQVGDGAPTLPLGWSAEHSSKSEPTTVQESSSSRRCVVVKPARLISAKILCLSLPRALVNKSAS